MLPVNGESDMKQKNNNILVKAALAFSFLGSGIQAAEAGRDSIMTVGGRTSQPIGHYEYCQKMAGDCQLVSRNTRPVKLTQQRWSEMVRANARANSTVTPVTDLEYYGTEELWTLPKAYGDCEDYALMKRRELMALGWPPSALLVTVVRQPNGDGHAVLTVRTDRADYVLDNLNGRILPWNETEYTYLKRQAAAHSGRWESIRDTRSVVGSIR